MAVLIYRPDLARWVNQEVGATPPGLDPTSLLLLNILIELRVHTQHMELQNARLAGDSSQTMREEVAFNLPLNAY